MKSVYIDEEQMLNTSTASGSKPIEQIIGI